MQPLNKIDRRTTTYPSFGHQHPSPLYVRSLHSNETSGKSPAECGRMSKEKSCLPVQSGTGFRMAGVGTSTRSRASPAYAARLQNASRVRKTSRCVKRYAAVTKSCVAATRGSPFRGVQMLCATPNNSWASARASSVWGRCMFISSPSKSALYGAQTHSLKRNVRHGSTLTECAMMDSLWRDGWRLNSTTSPSCMWRSTTSPARKSRATRFRSPNFNDFLWPPPTAPPDRGASSSPPPRFST
mmetsp:Transcript_31166/g.96457  ORF Transcript_31166/g.96457 Transcript_31166/m.96457 type:complete len:242 (+) Transcript_31166:1735-2460(+)